MDGDEKDKKTEGGEAGAGEKDSTEREGGVDDLLDEEEELQVVEETSEQSQAQQSTVTGEEEKPAKRRRQSSGAPKRERKKKAPADGSAAASASSISSLFEGIGPPEKPGVLTGAVYAGVGKDIGGGLGRGMSYEGGIEEGGKAEVGGREGTAEVGGKEGGANEEEEGGIGPNGSGREAAG